MLLASAPITANNLVSTSRIADLANELKDVDLTFAESKRPAKRGRKDFRIDDVSRFEYPVDGLGTRIIKDKKGTDENGL